MSGISIVVGAFALALIVMSFAVGGLQIFVIPIALVALAGVALLDLRRRRQSARRMQEHRDQAKTQSVEFSDRDRQTLLSD
jgi:cytochrome c-type biogenesis protein CcmH/NrfF